MYLSCEYLAREVRDRYADHPRNGTPYRLEKLKGRLNPPVTLSTLHASRDPLIHHAIPQFLLGPTPTIRFSTLHLRALHPLQQSRLPRPTSTSRHPRHPRTPLAQGRWRTRRRWRTILLPLLVWWRERKIQWFKFHLRKIRQESCRLEECRRPPTVLRYRSKQGSWITTPVLTTGKG